MPPRPISLAIVLVWLASIAWLIRTDYLARWMADGAPPFAIELADEAVPQVAYWGLFRNGKPIGRQQTTIAYRKDDTFEMTTRMTNVELTLPGIVVRIPAFQTAMVLTRDGDLIRFSTSGAMNATGAIGAFEFVVEIDGVVRGNELACNAGIGFSPPIEKQALDPVPLSSRRVLSPMQPLVRIRDLRPGRTWTMSKVDPLGQALAQASQQFVKRSLGEAFAKVDLTFGLGGSSNDSTAETILARVLDDTEMLPDGAGTSACFAIRYSEKDVVVGRTWVRVSDGRVMQQQAERFGDTLTLIREN